MDIRFFVTAPPSANRCYRSVGSKVLKSSAYRNWLISASNEAYLQVQQVAPMDGPLRVDLTAMPADHRIRDLDNYFKPMLDLLEVCAFIKDDRDVVEIHARRSPPDKATPHRVVMVVSTVAQSPPP